MSKDLYNRKLKDLRKHLRKEMTEAEEYLWKFLKKQQLGFKFRRQVSIGFFVVDFYCKDINLALELDGNIHDKESVIERDKIRQAIIECNGVYFLRFKNEDIFNNPTKVLETIKNTALSLRYLKNAPPCGELPA